MIRDKFCPLIVQESSNLFPQISQNEQEVVASPILFNYVQHPVRKSLLNRGIFGQLAYELLGSPENIYRQSQLLGHNLMPPKLY